MDSRIALLAAVRQPFTTGDAAALGVDRHTMADLARAGALHRVDRGAYVTAAVWHDASHERRHLLRCRAVLRRYGTVALSHTSAVVAHDLPTYGVDLSEVHLTRTKPGRMGKVATTFAVRVHPLLPLDAFATADGMPACAASAATLQVADRHGVAAGLVAAEAGLHRGVFSPSDLQQARDIVRLGRGRGNADAVIRLAGTASESPGETLTRLLLWTLGIEARQQIGIALHDGTVARVDFLLPTGVVVEFDGAVKYEGAGGRAALVREKRREDALRAAGHEVVRLTWPDLDRPEHVYEKIHTACTRATAATT